MSLQIPSAVLWDLDGTLIDSEHYWMTAEAQLASRYKASWAPSDGLDLVGLSLYESGRIMQERMGISDMSVEDIIRELTDSVLEQLTREIHWRPGARELLLDLRKREIPTAMVTMSMSRMAHAVAENLGFTGFDLVLGGDQVSQGKPHPAPYLEAARALGVEPAMCVSIEDSINGLASAEAAGTTAIAVPNLVEIPKAPGRIIWSTLEGKTAFDLFEVFATNRGAK